MPTAGGNRAGGVSAAPLSDEFRPGRSSSDDSFGSGSVFSLAIHSDQSAAIIPIDAQPQGTNGFGRAAGRNDREDFRASSIGRTRSRLREQLRPGTSARFGARGHETKTMTSPFQVAILAVLPNRSEEAIPPQEILRRLGIERPTPSQRASLSRSLSRLAARGLVVRFRQNIESRNYNWRRR